MDEHQQPNGVEACLIDLGEVKFQPPSKLPEDHLTCAILDSSLLIGHEVETESKNGNVLEQLENGIEPTGAHELIKTVNEFDPLMSHEFVVIDSQINESLDTACSTKDDYSKSDSGQTVGLEISMAEDKTKPVGLPTSGLPTPLATLGSPTKAKPPSANSPTKVPKLITNGDKGGHVVRPKSGVTKAKAATPTSQVPTAIPGCQRAVSVDRSKDSLSSPKTPSNTPVGTLDLLKLKSPADDCGGSTASTPRSSASHKESSRSHKVKSKIGSLDNSKHVPGGGNVNIMSQKVDYSQVTSRCGSKDNVKHIPKGGDKKIESRKLEWKVESKVGSLDNTKHKPGGGVKKIESVKLEWKGTSKVGSLDNTQHVAGGGTKKIESLKLDFKEKAQSKVGSKDNIGHKPGGGTKKIDSQKLNFKETAQPRIDASLKTSMKQEDEVAE